MPKIWNLQKDKHEYIKSVINNHTVGEELTNEEFDEIWSIFLQSDKFNEDDKPKRMTIRLNQPYFSKCLFFDDKPMSRHIIVGIKKTNKSRVAPYSTKIYNI